MENNLLHPQYCWISQKGAGTGKTWSCVGLVRNGPPGEQVTKFTTFIYLSKMNTAKAVIKEEFISQYGKHRCYFDGDVATIEAESLPGLAESLTGLAESLPGATTTAPVKVIVSTIDAMIYAFSNRDVMSYTRQDYFSELVYSFDINRPKFEEDEAIWNHIQFGPQTLVVIDECQDLEDGYIEKFMKNLATKGVSFYLMGDILQSVVEQNNIFEYLRLGKHQSGGFENVKFIRLDNSQDKIIRFHSNKFIDLVNDVVDFEYFGANPIASCCVDTTGKCGYVHDNEPQFLVETGDSTDSFRERLNQLVDINGYQPQDILIITPIVDNAFMYRLETEVNEYWADKINNGKCHQGQFCLLQTSKYGKIDLSVSQGKTRILSIHAAKGMGGTCVILVNLLDKSLLSHQTKCGELKYESIVHVALTRQKENFLVYYGGYGAEGVEEDILAKSILGLDNKLTTAPPKKRCVVPMDTLASGLKSRLDLINLFEERNSLRYRLGKLISNPTTGGFLEPIDLKNNLMVNTMMTVTWPMLAATEELGTEFKYMKPCFKRLVVLRDATITLSLDPAVFKMGAYGPGTELEIQDDVLGEAFLTIVDNIRAKLDTPGGTPPMFCPLESYVILYLFHKMSSFTTVNVGNIYHRMAKSINQGYRAEYHNDKICKCLDVLDKTVVAERKEDDAPLGFDDCDDEPLCDFGDFDDFGDLDMLDTPDEQQVETPVVDVPVNPLDSLYALLPEDNGIPQGLGMAMLAQIEDNFGYNPNFTIDLGMSDFFYQPVSDTGLVINLTVPNVTYVNFMNEITIPIMLYSYFIFKANDQLENRRFPLSHMFKPFVGIKQGLPRFTKITFHINRLDNNDRRVIEIPRDEQIFGAMDTTIKDCLTTFFSSFINSWVSYFKTVRACFNNLSPSEIDYIKKRFNLTAVPNCDLVESLKDVPAEIVGQILDVIDKKNFGVILDSVIKRVVNDFVTVKV